MNDWFFDTYERILSCETEANLRRELKKIIERFGFTGFAMTCLPNGRIGLQGAMLLTNWEAEWISRYSLQRYEQFDLVCKKAKQTAEMFSWSSAVSGHKKKAVTTQIMGEAAELRMVDGLVVPTPFKRLERIVFSLTVDGGKIDMSRREKLVLRAALAGISERFHTLSYETRKTGMTIRQVEVLQQLAYGCSVSETANDLNVSVSTVRKHCENIRHQYQTTSIMEAIFKARNDGAIQF